MAADLPTSDAASAPECWVCNAPITDAPTILSLYATPPKREVKAHRPCAVAWIEDDDGELYDLRTKACADGHHRFPGQWTRVRSDPFGDASSWACAKGCGHIEEHPGYGIGRAIAEREGSLFHA